MQYSHIVLLLKSDALRRAGVAEEIADPFLQQGCCKNAVDEFTDWLMMISSEWQFTETVVDLYQGEC